MAKLTLKKGLTDVTVYLFVQDSSKTTGEGLTGLAYNTANLVASYVRPLGSRTAITLATLAAVTSAHTDGGFIEIDATNMPGVYRLDLPDAVCATGVPSAVVMLKGASNMTPVLLEIQLTDFDLNSTSNTVGTVTNLTNLPSIPNNWLTAAGIAADAGAEIADAVWDEAISGHTTAGSFGAKNQKVVPSETIGDYKADVSSLATSAALATVGSNVTSIKTKTDNLPASPAAVGSAMTLSDNAITAAVIATDAIDADAIKADAVSEIQSGLATASALATVAGYVDDLEGRLTATRAGYLDKLNVSGTLAHSDAAATYKADVSGIPAAVWGHATRTLSSFGTLVSDIWSAATRTLSAFAFTVTGAKDASIDAIKAKTDTIPASPAAVGSAMTLADDAITASKFDESTAFPVKLADTGATQIARVGADSDTLGTLSDQLDAIDDYIDTEVAAIKAKTDLITTGTTLTIASAVVGSTITAHRGDTLSAALENIGALTNYSKLWFTVKRDYDDADTAAVIQIEKTGGLLYLNGAVGTAGNGSLTINDVASGDVTIVLNASETAKLSPGNYQYDIQILRSAGTPVSTLTYGEFVVAADVTRATA
jgi:hypothetical protein